MRTTRDRRTDAAPSAAGRVGAASVPASTRGDQVAGLLEGRTALVVGVLNKRSIATAIASAFAQAGARLALTYQNERTQRDVGRVADALPGHVPLFPLDVTDDDQCDAAVSGAADALGGIDILVHAVAFAKADDLEGRFADTSRDGFLLAQEISAYSLVALARRVEPSMLARGGGSCRGPGHVRGDGRGTTCELRGEQDRGGSPGVGQHHHGPFL